MQRTTGRDEVGHALKRREIRLCRFLAKHGHAVIDAAEAAPPRRFASGFVVGRVGRCRVLFLVCRMGWRTPLVLLRVIVLVLACRRTRLVV